MMAKLPLRILPAALIAVLALSPGIVAAGGAAQPQSSDKQNLSFTQYPGWGDPVMAAIAVNSGRALVQQLQGVNASLATGDIVHARSQLVTCGEFAQALQGLMPYMVVVDRITNAEHQVVAKDVSVFSDDLLPIYANLDRLGRYAPRIANQAKRRVKEAQHKAQMGDEKGATNALAGAAAEISQSSVYLPVTYVEAQVDAARQALVSKPANSAAARRAVRRALDSLTTITRTTAHG